MALNFKMDDNNVQSSFSTIASEIMNKWVLKAGDSSYRICELEFYYKSKSHQDPYIHGHDLQKEMGKWYFHGSGLDMTFGSEKCPGSILIRAIYNLDEPNNYIYGPVKTVTELFANLPDIYSGDFSLRLEADDKGLIKKEDKRIFDAPRVGLNPDKDLNGSFCLKKYRFFVMPSEQHVGIENALRGSKLSNKEVNEILGYDIKG